MPPASVAESVLTIRGKPKRAYRKPLGPRTYRTRVDPFAEVWPEVQGWLEAQPERTGKSLFDELQQRYPGTFSAGQLRTLQHRVHDWRLAAIVTFDAQWLSEDPLAEPPTAGTLRGVAFTNEGGSDADGAVA
jgi:hypothetical protein